VILPGTCKLSLFMELAFPGQESLFAACGNSFRCPRGHVTQQINIGRIAMNEQKNNEPEQTGKQLAFGIIGFIVGTIAVLYLLKLLLF